LLGIDDVQPVALPVDGDAAGRPRRWCRNSRSVADGLKQIAE